MNIKPDYKELEQKVYLLEQEVKQYKKNEIALRNSEQKYRTLFEESIDALSILDADSGKFIECNSAAVNLHGTGSRDVFLGLTPDQLSPKHQPCGKSSYDLAMKHIKATVNDGSNVFEWMHCKNNGTTFPALVSLSAMKLDNKMLIVAIGRDTSKIKEVEREKEKILHEMGERMKELQCMYGITEAIRKHHNLESFLYNIIEIIPLGWHYPEHTRVRITLDDKEFIKEPFELTKWKLSREFILGDKHRGCLEVYYIKEFPELEYGPFRVQELQLIDGIIQTVSEAIERKDVEAELEHLAAHDALTGLPNRRHFKEYAENKIAQAQRSGEKVAFLYIDLDGFKAVNDQISHQAGDIVLTTIAQRFMKFVRKNELIARIGGDEFCMVIYGYNDVSELDNTAKRLNEACTKIISIGSTTFIVGMSIGIATYPDNGKTYDKLMSMADDTMYKIKNKAKGSYAFVE